MEPARIRTINECMSEIRKRDPESSLTYNFIKKLCDRREVKHIKHGRKYFVNFDDLLLYLSK
jgi:hypothetical protein